MPIKKKLTINDYKVIYGSPWDRDFYAYPDVKKKLKIKCLHTIPILTFWYLDTLTTQSSGKKQSKNN